MLIFCFALIFAPLKQGLEIAKSDAEQIESKFKELFIAANIHMGEKLSQLLVMSHIWKVVCCILRHGPVLPVVVARSQIV